MTDLLFLERALLDGILLSLLLGILVLGSLVYNARLWLQDYPKPIRDKVPPLSPTEKRERVVMAVLFIGILLGGLLLATLRIRASQGGALTFGAAYLQIFLILFVFNLFDALVLDLFVLTLLKPRFAILPGSEGMEYLLYDYRKQLVDFLKGLAFCAIGSLPFAAIAIL